MRAGWASSMLTLRLSSLGSSFMHATYPSASLYAISLYAIGDSPDVLSASARNRLTRPAGGSRLAVLIVGHRLISVAAGLGSPAPARARSAGLGGGVGGLGRLALEEVSKPSGGEDGLGCFVSQQTGPGRYAAAPVKESVTHRYLTSAAHRSSTCGKLPWMTPRHPLSVPGQRHAPAPLNAPRQSASGPRWAG